MSRLLITLAMVAMVFTLVLLVTARSIEAPKNRNGSGEPCEDAAAFSKKFCEAALEGKRAEPGSVFDINTPLWQKFINENTIVCP